MFKKILVGVDDTNRGRDAIELAKQLAASDAELTIGHVYKRVARSGAAVGLTFYPKLDQARQQLERSREDASEEAKLVLCAAQSVAEGLHQLARDGDADLLVMGSGHRGPRGRISGDDVRSTLRGAPCPVALAPVGYCASAQPIAEVGIGCDGSAGTDLALAAARDFAARHGAGLKAMSVVPACAAVPEGWLQTGLPGLATDQYQDQLTRFGKEMDLLVVGAPGRGSLSPLMEGGTSDHLLRYLGCPLLVIPGSAWANSTPRALASSGAAG